MDTSSPAEAASEPIAGVSRRLLLTTGSAGLALAFLGHTSPPTLAQTPAATPEATGGMPPGVALLPITNIPVPAADVPAGGFALSIYRVTLEAGANFPSSTFPYPTTFFVETGVFTCPGNAPRYLITTDGHVRNVGDEAVPIHPGEGFYIPPNVLDGGRNDGTEKVSILEVDLVPLASLATPAP